LATSACNGEAQLAPLPRETPGRDPYQPSSRSTFYVNATAWSRGLEVTGGGTGIVSHAGLVLLRQLADRTGLTAGLSASLPSPDGGLDRGRVFAGLACAIADGAG
jgi:hypothetical protein